MRAFVFWLVNLFYNNIEITGAERVPESGGMIIVSNHPNGIIDPIPLMIRLNRPVAFLAKSTIWAIPIVRNILDAFNALPIFRHRDDGLKGGPNGDAAERNEVTFARARQLLRAGQALALFPEGVTHSESQLLPLKTGAARIALQSEAESGWSGQIPVVPIGLWYEDKTRFRSSVLLVVGSPFTLETFRSAYLEADRETVRAVTSRIDEALDEVVLQAESREILQALPYITRWLNEGKELTLEEQHAQMGQLMAVHDRLQAEEPERLALISTTMRRYDALLRALGMKDPWQLALPRFPGWYLFGQLVGLLLTAPLAMPGALLGALPYLATRYAARGVTGGDYTQIGTAKIAGGLLFFILLWLATAILVGIFLTLGWGLLAFLVIPAALLFALGWLERAQTLFRRLRLSGWRGRRRAIHDHLREERATMAQMVRSAIIDYGPPVE